MPLYASWQRLFWKDPKGSKVYVVQAFGFDPDRPPFLIPEVRELSARLKTDNAVLVDRRSRPFLGMGGDARETEINGKPVQIAGSFALGPDFMSNGTVMMSSRTFAALLAGNPAAAATLPVEFGVVKLRPGQRCRVRCSRQLRGGAASRGARPDQAGAGRFRARFPGGSVVRRADLLDGHAGRLCRRHADLVPDHLHRPVGPAAAIRHPEGHGVRHRAISCGWCSSRRRWRRWPPLCRPGCCALSSTGWSANSPCCRCT